MRGRRNQASSFQRRPKKSRTIYIKGKKRIREELQEDQDEQAAFSEALPIHSCVQFGNLINLQERLAVNPSLINVRDANMSQTPLHVAALYNNAMMVRVLLDWNGPEKVELEARNWWGETPLHVAAANGCNEAARLLLDYGALIEARTKNEMTPLHLGVCYSAQKGDFSITRTLLEYGADCHVLDNGLIPAYHLSQDLKSNKLLELLCHHIEQQTKWKALYVEAKDKLEFTRAMANFVGLNYLKSQLNNWAMRIVFNEMRRSIGFNVGDTQSFHMAFLGDPDKGQTTIAQILGSLLHKVGYLPSDKVIEVQRTDLVGENFVLTDKNTSFMINKAEGGILFVDEADTLVPMEETYKKEYHGYGSEAFKKIMSAMGRGEITAIFSGRSERMAHMVLSNKEFHQMTTEFFFFDDCNAVELSQILLLKPGNQKNHSRLRGFWLAPHVEAQKEMSGGLVDILLLKAQENLNVRLSSGSEFDFTHPNAVVTITMADLEVGLRSLQSEKSLQQVPVVSGAFCLPGYSASRSILGNQLSLDIFQRPSRGIIFP